VPFGFTKVPFGFTKHLATERNADYICALGKIEATSYKRATANFIWKNQIPNMTRNYPTLNFLSYPRLVKTFPKIIQMLTHSFNKMSDFV